MLLDEVMPKDLDHTFDEYLKAHEPEAIQAIQEFSKRLDKSDFKYGRFTIPAFFKAHFINQKQEHLLKRIASTLHQIINTASRLYFEEGHVSHMYRINPEAAELIKIDPGYSKTVVFSRFDTLLEGESLKIVELNCDAPAGAAYSEQLEEILTSGKLFKEFAEKNHLELTHKVAQVLESLLETYEEFGGYENPQIAIVDWKRSRTSSELQFFQKYFEEKGYKTVIADPRDLKYKSGKLYHKNFRVHLIYRRVAFEEILERRDDMKDMLQAYKDRNVCVVNPLRSRLASTKALLSILTNSDYDHFFTENENEIKREHILWTRRLGDADAFFRNKKMYLIDFFKDQKESLVLKPSSGYGGKDVLVGCEARDEDWNGAIDKALKEDWVMQEYAHVPIMTVPTIVNEKLDFAYKKYNYNMLVFGGKFAGGFSRLSDESVINVARGGGLIPSLGSEYIPDRFGG